MSLFRGHSSGSPSRKNRGKSARRRRTSVQLTRPFHVQVESVEARIAPVVGAFALGQVVAQGSGFDGVVTYNDGLASCTGTLMTTGRHILTAAHCVDDDGDGVADAANYFVTFELPTGDITMTVPGTDVIVHPGWGGSADILGGNDLAILELPALAPYTAEQYGIYTNTNEVGQTFQIVGYGRTGTGTTGNQAGTGGTKRTGFNRWDAVADVLNAAPMSMGLTAPANTTLAYDFDNGLAANDAFGAGYGINNLGQGANEGMQAPGDSGGPAFIGGLISGIVSFSRQRYASPPDIDGVGNNTFGEFAVMTRVSSFAGYINTQVAGAFDLVFDMNAQPEGNNGGADLITVRRNGANLEILVGASVAYSGAFANVRSLSVLGSDDDDTLRIEETASGLVSFASASPFSIAGAGIDFDGGLGSDALQMVFTTSRTNTYRPTNVGAANSGTYQLSGLANTYLSFEDLAPVVVAGLGALNVDATALAGLNTININDLNAANDGLSIITGNGGFESITFSGFTSLSVLAGNGPDTVNLNSLDPATSLTSARISGDNTTSTDNSAETLFVGTLPGTVTATLVASAGPETYVLGNTTIDNINGQVIVGALGVAGGVDQLLVNDFGSASNASNVVVTSTTIDGITFAPAPDITYNTGEPIELVVINRGVPAPLFTNFNVRSTAATTNYRLIGGGANDGFNISSDAPTNTGNLNAILGPIEIQSGGGTDTLNVIDQTGPARTYALNTAGAFTRLTATGIARIDFLNPQLENFFLRGSTGGNNTYQVNVTSATVSNVIEDGLAASSGNANFIIQANQLQAGAANRFFGHAGFDRFRVVLNGVNPTGGTFEILGGSAPAGTRDKVAFDEGGVNFARTATFVYNAAGADFETGGTDVVMTEVESILYNGEGAPDNISIAALDGNNDVITVNPYRQDSAVVFYGGQPFNGPPEVFENRRPGVAGGAIQPDIRLTNIETNNGLQVFGNDTAPAPDNRLYVYGSSENSLVDPNAQAGFDLLELGFGAAEFNALMAAHNVANFGAGTTAFDTITAVDGQVAIDNRSAAIVPLLRVNYFTADFAQTTPIPGVTINGGQEVGADANGVADDFLVTLSNSIRYKVNGNRPFDPTDVTAPTGDRMAFNAFAVDVYSDQQDPPNVGFTFYDFNNVAFLPVIVSSIENMVISVVTVNLLGDNGNENPIPDQNDEFLVTGVAPPFPFETGYFNLNINGSSPIRFQSVINLNAFGRTGNDRTAIQPYAVPTTPWNINIFADGGTGVDTFAFTGVDGQPDAITVEADATAAGRGRIFDPGIVTNNVNGIAANFIGTERVVANANTDDGDTLVIRTTNGDDVVNILFDPTPLGTKPGNLLLNGGVSVLPDDLGIADLQIVGRFDVSIDRGRGVLIRQPDNSFLPDPAVANGFLGVRLDLLDGIDTVNVNLVAADAPGRPAFAAGGGAGVLPLNVVIDGGPTPALGSDFINLQGNSDQVDNFGIEQGSQKDNGELFLSGFDNFGFSVLSFVGIEGVSFDGLAGPAVDSATIAGSAVPDVMQLNPAPGSIGFLTQSHGPDVVIVGLGGGTDARVNLLGQAGNDQIKVAPGVENFVGIVIEGGDGDDFLSADATILGGAGNDTIVGGAGDDSLVGDAGDDLISGGTGNDTIEGGTGNDTIDGETGDDSMLGGDGDDLFLINDLGVGTNTYDGGAGVDRVELIGTVAVDVITIDAATTTLTDIELFHILALNGADLITVTGTFTAPFLVDAGAGSDIVDLSGATPTGSTVLGGDGDDFIFGSTIGDEVHGGDGDDLLVGNDGSDTLLGEAGDDEFIGGLGLDFLQGGDGNDTFTWNVGDGVDLVSGGEDTDNLVVFGSAADELFRLSPSNSILLVSIDATTLSVADVEAVSINTDAGADTTIVDDVTTTPLKTLNVDMGAGAANALIVHGTTSADNIGFDLVAPGVVNFSGLSYELNATTVSLNDAVTVFGNSGNDTIKAASGVETVFLLTIDGGDGDDLLSADATIFGGAGNDTITGGIGNDSLVGGGGDDLIFGLTGDDTIEGGDGDDTLFGNEGNDSIDGGAGDDTIQGNDGDDTITGGAGDDTIDGGLGDDSMAGGDGNDIFLINDLGVGTNSYDGGPGNDTVSLTGTEFADVITFPAANTVTNVELFEIHALGGNDVITVSGAFAALFIVDAGSGNDSVNLSGLTPNAASIVGGSGNDTITGSTSTDTILGGEGNDSINGAAGVDSIDGGSGNDTIFGGTGFDFLFGGDGSDLFTWNPGDGSDLLEGGDGEDILLFNGSAADETFTLSHNGTRLQLDRNVGAINQNMAEIEQVDLFTFAGTDTIIINDVSPTALKQFNVDLAGDANADVVTINGGPAGDVMGLDVTGPSQVTVQGLSELIRFLNIGANDNLTLNGLAGNDTITMAAGVESVFGATLINGGQGNDFLAGDTTINGDSGDDVIYGDAGVNLIGGIFNNVLNGGDGHDTIFGGTGNDTITGGDGNDLLYGEDGFDLITGDAGDDTLDGGNNNDTLFGGEGVDSLVGGTGNDVIWAVTNGVTARTTADTLIGDDGDDLLNGSDGDNVMDGGNGNDTINAFAGDDDIIGGAGNDLIDAGIDDDTVDAGRGDDTVLAGAGDDLVDAGQGNNSVVGGAGRDTISAGGGDDTITGDAGNDVIDAGDGANLVSGGDDDDVITTGIGNDTIDAGNGDDNVFASQGANSITGGAGNDTIVALGGADTITGDDGADNISAGDGNNLVDGGAGNDTIAALTGNDTITGGTGADSISAGDGDNTISGGDGNDTITALTGNDTIDAGAGADLVSAGDGNNSITGGAGRDTITALTGNDTITGDADNDVIDAGDGANLVDGGSEDDIIKTGNGNDTIIGGTGDDDIYAAQGANSITGGAGNDTIVALGGNDTITGNDGRDTIDAGDGNNLVNGGTGDDIITTWVGNDTITGDDGDDLIHAGQGNNTVTGGAGNDTITALGGNDTIQGNDGADLISAGDGANLLDGGIGNDTITAGTGNDTITAGDGDDVVHAGDGNNTITGGLGDDIITAGSGNDTIDAGAGDDNVHAGQGANTIFGGAGNDTLTALGGSDLITGDDGADLISAGDGNNTVTGGAGNDTITAGIGNDTITGDDGADVINAGDGNNTVRGGSGSDTIVTGTGTDLIFGDDGNDVINSGEGNDTIEGGNGDDTIQASFGNDFVQGGNGNDVIDGGDGNDTLCGNDDNDSITGGDGDDLILGNEKNDTLAGGLGQDSIFGGSGEDTIFGNEGRDLLDGGTGNDLVRGGDGNDLIFGGFGNDSLYGGLGNDSIYGNDNDDYLHGGDGTENQPHTVRPVRPNDGDDLLVGGSGNDGLDGGSGNNILDAGFDGIHEFITAGRGNDIAYVTHKEDATALDGGKNRIVKNKQLNDLIAPTEPECAVGVIVGSPVVVPASTFAPHQVHLAPRNTRVAKKAVVKTPVRAAALTSSATFRRTR